MTFLNLLIEGVWDELHRHMSNKSYPDEFLFWVLNCIKAEDSEVVGIYLFLKLKM